MKWLEIKAVVDTECVEAVSEVFSRYVYGGVSIEQEALPLGDEEYTFDATRPVVMKGYVPLDESAESKVKLVEEGLWHLGLIRPMALLQTSVVDDEDWKNAWKQFYDVHRVGKRIVVKPSWRDYRAQPGDIVLAIDPGMAFGTGLHPTTQMCLIELEQYVRPGDVILDLGTGTGILALAAARLGAASVLALDTDSVAVSAARQNVAMNCLGDIIRVELGTIPFSDERSMNFSGYANGFDIVVANIIAKVIAELSDAIAAVVRPDGIVIASGIIEEKRDWVAERLKAAGLTLVSESRCGDWVTLIERKTSEV